MSLPQPCHPCLPGRNGLYWAMVGVGLNATSRGPEPPYPIVRKARARRTLRAAVLGCMGISLWELLHFKPGGLSREKVI